MHVNENVLRSIHKHSKDVPRVKGKLEICAPCRLGKATKKSFDSHFEPANYPGEVVHSDLAGPIHKSIHGRTYFITFVDQHTRYTHVMGLTAKSEASEAFDMYQQSFHVKKYYPKGIERLHSDGGGEYANTSANDASNTTPETPQHNPFAERINRTYLDPIRTLLEQAVLSAKYWEYALDHVAYVKNRLYHSAIKRSLFEALTGKKPTLKHVRVFGCSAFVYNHAPASKVHARAVPGIFLGCNDHGVYIVERLTDRKVINSVHVTFDESTFPGLEKSDSSSCGESESSIYDDSESYIFPEPDTASDSESSVIESEDSSTNRYPKRFRKQPERLGYSSESHSHHAHAAISFPITTSDAPTIKEAMSATPPEVKLWEIAIQEELSSLNEMGTWNLIDRRNVNGKIRVLPTHVVLKIKRDEYGIPERFKARIVAGGNLQVVGQDVIGIYAPVVDYSIVLLTLAVCVQLDWHTAHVDVKSAFLNGEIDQETIVSHPFNVPSHLKSNNYYKLNKALYGLRQAPLQWFKKLREVLVDVLHFKQLQSDGSVFIKTTNVGGSLRTTVALCYVDDLIFASNTIEELRRSIDQFLSVFNGTQEPLHWYLAVRMDSLNDGFALSQSSYIESALQDFEIKDIRKEYTPIQANFYDELEVHKDDKQLKDNQYRNMIGTLQFLASRTRPDISTAVGILSQFTNKPNEFLLKCVKRVFGYLKATIDYGLFHKKSKDDELKLEFYCDSDFGGDKGSRKSRSGWIGYLNGCPFTWASIKQTSNATSTAEAEYIAMSTCAKEVTHYRLFLAELGFKMNYPILIYGDNVAAQYWAKDTITMRKAKHIEIRYHFIRHKVKDGTILPSDVNSENNYADGFTKPLDRKKFTEFCENIGVKPRYDAIHQEEC